MGHEAAAERPTRDGIPRRLSDVILKWSLGTLGIVVTFLSLIVWEKSAAAELKNSAQDLRIEVLEKNAQASAELLKVVTEIRVDMAEQKAKVVALDAKVGTLDAKADKLDAKLDRIIERISK